MRTARKLLVMQAIVVDKHSGEFCPACDPIRLPASLRDVSHPHSYIEGECDEEREASDDPDTSGHGHK